MISGKSGAGAVRRLAAALPVLCASLAAPLLGVGGSAQAADLVSNFNQTATTTSFNFGNSGTDDLAQVFTTGDNATGYTLTSIEMAFGSGVVISPTDIGDLSVSVWSVDGSGHPQTKQFDLTNPASIAAATVTPHPEWFITGTDAVFSAPSDTRLTMMTDYAVVLTFDQNKQLFHTSQLRGVFGRQWLVDCR